MHFGWSENDSLMCQSGVGKLFFFACFVVVVFHFYTLSKSFTKVLEKIPNGLTEYSSKKQQHNLIYDRRS